MLLALAEVVYMPHLKLKNCLVTREDVTGVDLVADVVEARVIAVGDDGVAESLELGKVVDYA